MIDSVARPVFAFSYVPMFFSLCSYCLKLSPYVLMQFVEFVKMQLCLIHAQLWCTRLLFESRSIPSFGTVEFEIAAEDNATAKATPHSESPDSLQYLVISDTLVEK